MVYKYSEDIVVTVTFTTSKVGNSYEVAATPSVTDKDGKIGNDTVTTIGMSAFNSAAALTGVTIPAGVKTIGAHAFTDSGLTSVSIPEGVTTIRYRAFNSCMDMVSVFLPSTVTSIGALAFECCDALKHIYYTNNTDAWDGMSIANKNLAGVDENDKISTNAALGIKDPSIVKCSFNGELTITLNPNGGTLKDGTQASWSRSPYRDRGHPGQFISLYDRIRYCRSDASSSPSPISDSIFLIR